MDPAQPPININIKKKNNGKLPQLLKFSVTYPVPVNIDITLKLTDKKPLSDKLLLNIARYINNITIEIITILKNDFICISDINIFLSPPINFRYAINGMLPDKIKIIEVISIYEFLK